MNETNITLKEATIVEKTVMTLGTTTEDIGQRFEEASSIVVPLLVFIGIMVLSALVYLMIRQKRLIRVYHNFGTRKPYGDSSYITEPLNDDFETDDPTECLLKGELHIDNNYQRSYQATTGLHA